MLLKKEDFPKDDWAWVSLLNRNYEYCYLESMHKMLNEEDPANPYQLLILGSSYGLDDIEEKYMDSRLINLSMHSQDLYYDMLHIKQIFGNDRMHIKDCLFFWGYYNLYYDLSMCSVRWKCMRNYGPLFGNLHHAGDLEEQLPGILSEVKNMDFQKWYHTFFEEFPKYYGRAITREDKNPYFKADGGLGGNWGNADPQIRTALAQWRCKQHNNHYKHRDTFHENIRIMYFIFKMLDAMDIKTHVIIPPFSQEYLHEINMVYKSEMYCVLNELPYAMDFIDFNESNQFASNDFADPDHLNLDGAIKFTKLLNQVL